MIDYDPHDWDSHLYDIQGSMIREIFGRVLTCVIWSVVVVAGNKFILAPNEYSMSFPETAHSLIGVALGLLLVFRTNASYDRFWEGRKQWGAIVNESRNLARTSSVYLAAAPDLVRPLLMWTSVFAWATLSRLRGKTELGAIASQLPPAETLSTIAEGHAPLAVSRRMTGILAEARRRGLISDYVLVALDQNVQLLIDYMGACERIRTTRMPFAYMVHLRRALILYCFTLPCALFDRFGWGTVPAVLLISYLLFGIEEIGVEIEDPFGEDDNDLPLERICETIEDNLRRTMETLDTGSAGAAPLPTL